MLALLGRHVYDGFARIATEEARLEAQGKVLFVAPGDVWVRDLPKVTQFLNGHFFTDPHFGGEPHWYPFLLPMTAAAIAEVGGYAPSSAYHRVEVLVTALSLVGLFLITWCIGRRSFLVMLPVAGIFGWITPGIGLYPAYAVRGALLILLSVAGLILLKAGSPYLSRRASLFMAFGLGLLTGLIGLFNGAAFFVSLAVTIVVSLRLGLRSPGTNRAACALPLLLSLVGAAVPMAFLLLPQLLRYGTLKQAEAARLFADPRVYGAGNDWRAALRSPLLVEGWNLAFVGCFFGLLIATIPWAWLRAIVRPVAVLPLALAYVLCIGAAHTGFFLHDERIPRIARFVRATLPSPPRSFEIVAHASLVIPMQLLAAGWLTLAAWRLLVERTKIGAALHLGSHNVRNTGWVAVAVVASFWLPFVRGFDTSIPFHWAPEDKSFYEAATHLREVAGEGIVYGEVPLRMIAASGLRLFSVNLPEHSNHYVGAARLRTVAKLRGHLARGEMQSVNEILDRHNVAYLFKTPGMKEPVVDQCAGQLLAEGSHYRLFARGACRP